MYRPPHLKPGDKVALISPAGAMDSSYMPYALTVLQEWGLEPVIGRYALEQYGYFAGTDEQRLADLQWALDTEDIRAIFCTRGGYGTLRIVEQIDYSRFQGTPKWIVGFSDITVLHTKINALGFETIHGAMPKTFSTTSVTALERMREFLFGHVSTYKLPSHPLNIVGDVEAELNGGNLTMLHALAPTRIRYRYPAPILFMEEINEQLYAVDRMLQSLKLSRALTHVQAFLFGSFSNIDESGYGKSCAEVLHEFAQPFNVPACFNFPAGHTEENFPLILGSTIRLAVDSQGTEIEFV
ncbi:MAG: S66 peptidase family protein [Marinifilaceae bacterium]